MNNFNNPNNDQPNNAPGGNRGPEGQGLSNVTLLKGIGAMMLGLVCIIISYRVILEMIFFVTGFFLLYAGLMVLNLGGFLRSVDCAIARIRNFFHFDR